METMYVSVLGLQWSSGSYFRNHQLDWRPEEQRACFAIVDCINGFVTHYPSALMIAGGIMCSELSVGPSVHPSHSHEHIKSVITSV